MARSSSFLLMFLVLFASFCNCIEGRNLVVGGEKQWKKMNMKPPSRDSLFLSALPKGTVPSSSPTKKGHAVVVDEKLIERHLISMDRRLLIVSAPSPGIGH
ncbi:precursor of CEP14 [Lathyrus oleraceus]|uniref:precursor of CEP14 n=1 Tax=Pisum sativum TaxID=3888 RepID=UPI001FC48FFD|nr:precursor of CEP14-like [Pisum sativum]